MGTTQQRYPYHTGTATGGQPWARTDPNQLGACMAIADQWAANCLPRADDI